MSARPGVQGLLRRPRRAEDRDPGRDQEGLPQARPGAPSGRASPATPPPSGASRRSTRPTRSWAIPRSASSTTSSARTGRRSARAGAGGRGRRRRSVRRLRWRRPVRARPATSATSSGRAGDAGDFSRLLPDVLRRPTDARPASGTARGRGARPRRPVVRGHPGRMGLDDGVTHGGSRPGAGASRPLAGPTPTAEAIAEITLDEAFHGTTRLVEVDGKRLEVTIPRGADTGTRIRLTGKGPGGGDLFVVVRVRPHAGLHPARRRPRARAAAHPRGGAPRRRGPGRRRSRAGSS